MLSSVQVVRRRPARAQVTQRKADIDVIVPEFNELSRRPENFDSQADYFVRLSRMFDVILVDDASSDGSWEKLVDLNAKAGSRLRLFRMEKNGQKVAAIKRAVDASRAEFVLLTDFDSTVMKPELIPGALEKFRENPRLASLSLRLLPEGGSLFSRFQDIEYAIGRAVFSRYMLSQKMLRCVSGAAGIWRRSVLQGALKEHSGRHNGDDFEVTTIAMRQGYAMGYDPSIVVETLVPQGPVDLFRQRRRWELGALETYEKENRFYRKQILGLRSKLGHITILDWYAWLTTLLFPVFIINGLLNHAVLEIYACIELSLTGTVGYLSRNEVKSRRELMLLPIFPLYRLFATVPRLAAMYRFLRGRKPRQGPLRPPRDRGLWAADSPQQVAALTRLLNRIA
jgi:cellulose synthase/poly-beta-1,6-N-acetylglucosamine synthase-like glycosyltransferase